MIERFDFAVVGAGVVGLAHAYHLAKAGKRVVVVERGERAQGASVRNFGMLWPIGQPEGEMHALASRSLEIWRDVLKVSGLWNAPCGSLHLAYHGDEESVLSEFAAKTEFGGTLLAASEVRSRFPAVNPSGLRAGLFSSSETTVDPREIIAKLPAWLEQTFNVHFVFGTAARRFENGVLHTDAGNWNVDQVIICTGVDFRELAPEAFDASNLTSCKLQMMRTPPIANRLGTMIAGGLTLRHYKAFASCPSLEQIIARFDRDVPEYHRFGIHVMAAQNGLGEIVIGDSHEYGSDITPFDRAEIDELILTYLRTLLAIKTPIASRWHGIYLKCLDAPFVISRPRPGLTAVNGLGGAGMTLSFGLAERVVKELL